MAKIMHFSVSFPKLIVILIWNNPPKSIDFVSTKFQKDLERKTEFKNFEFRKR